MIGSLRIFHFQRDGHYDSEKGLHTAKIKPSSLTLVNYRSMIFEILKKTKNVRNSLAPINKLPLATLALVAGSLKPGCKLFNAIAVCQHWRTTLLSFPQTLGQPLSRFCAGADCNIGRSDIRRRDRVVCLVRDLERLELSGNYSYRLRYPSHILSRGIRNALCTRVEKRR